MPSKQSRNVKVQSRPVSSSVSDEQTFYDRVSLIVKELNDHNVTCIVTALNMPWSNCTLISQCESLHDDTLRYFMAEFTEYSYININSSDEKKPIPELVIVH